MEIVAEIAAPLLEDDELLELLELELLELELELVPVVVPPEEPPHAVREAMNIAVSKELNRVRQWRMAN
ncbi:hypothetical protein [Teredinibacter turnerae]|uniref:hypothetical protein n=1 Tax=Teredinibacter turnerae TaxID=2426 RepID=UPI00036F8B92|nr:hypothetical protein [Teredinibacter turnerae]